MVKVKRQRSNASALVAAGEDGAPAAKLLKNGIKENVKGNS